MRRSAGWIVSTAIVITSTVADVAARPARVRLVDGDWATPAASPDARLVGYFGGDGRLVIWDLDRRAERDAYLPFGTYDGRPQFSGDSSRVAFRIDGICHVLELTTGKATVQGPCVGFSFDADGKLTWITDREIWREGGVRAIATLPWTSMPASEGGYRYVTESSFGPRPLRGTSQIVMSCAIDPMQRSSCHRIWATDVATRATRVVFDARSRGELATAPIVAPGQDRVCYATTATIECAHVATGKISVLERVRAMWGHSGMPAQAFSPSGAKVVYVEGGFAERTLHVHDFAAGTSTIVVRDSLFSSAAFHDDDTLLATGGGAAVWIDVATGQQDQLIKDMNGYSMPVLIPGRRDRLWCARARGPGRELVEIEALVGAGRRGASPRR